MSTWQNMRLVAGRELRETMRRRSFWIIVAVVLAASVADAVAMSAAESASPYTRNAETPPW